MNVSTAAFAPSPLDSPSTLTESTTGERARRELVLADPRVRHFLATQGLGQWADAFANLTLANVVVFGIEKGASPDTVVRALVVAALPHLVSMLLSQIVADRWRRGATLAAIQLLRCLMTFAAVLVPLTKNAGLGYVAVTALLSASAVANSVRSASLPHVVHTRQLVTLNSLSSVAAKCAGILGAVTFLLVRATPVAALAIAGAIHLIGGVNWLRWRCRLGGGRAAVAERSAGDGVSRSVIALVVEQPFRLPVRSALMTRMLQGATLMSLLIAAERVGGLGTIGYTTALGATSLGASIGAVVVPFLLNRHGSLRVSRLTGSLASTALVAALVHRGHVLGVVTLLALGLAFQARRLLSDATVQRHLRDAVRGRVCSLYELAFQSAFIVGAVLASSVPVVPYRLSMAVLVALHLLNNLVDGVLPSARAWHVLHSRPRPEETERCSHSTTVLA